jgi:HAD superfamily hydrolase (TIGR01490 family)
MTAGRKPLNLALFDLDGTLLAGDSDYSWAQFLISRGVLQREFYETENQRFFEDYKAGTLDIHAFLDFQLAPLAAHPRPQLDAWHADFMRERVMKMITRHARELVQRHLDAGDLCAVVTATNSFVTANIVREFGIPHLVATEPEMKDGAFTGKVNGMPCFREGKIARVEAWLAQTGPQVGAGATIASFARSWFYSDSRNDIPLLEKVTDPVVVDPDTTLHALALARNWPVISLR